MSGLVGGCTKRSVASESDSMLVIRKEKPYPPKPHLMCTLMNNINNYTIK
jgi:hypothetical protein